MLIFPMHLRRLTRLQVMLRKSVEFRIFHMQQYEVFTRRLRIFYYLMTLVSTSVSVILLVFVDHQWSTIAASAASILVGILASYTRFVKYEGTAEGHLNASKTFEDVARDINTFFASVTPDQLDKVNIQELVQDMENDSAEERSTYSTTAASSAKVSACEYENLLTHMTCWNIWLLLPFSSTGTTQNESFPTIICHNASCMYGLVARLERKAQTMCITVAVPMERHL